MKTVSPSSHKDAPKRKATVEDVEDEDEIKWKSKTALETETEIEPEPEPEPSTPPKPLKPLAKGKAERFLEQLKLMKDKRMKYLHRWAARGRHEEITTSLLQSLLTAPAEDAIRTLDDLKSRRHCIARMGSHSLNVPINFQTTDTAKNFSTEGLIDCGATGAYIDKAYAESQDLNLDNLSHPIPVYNADKTLNEGGPIRQVVTLRMRIADHVETITFGVTNTGNDRVILGFSWLKRHNPNVDWRAGKLLFNRCPAQCAVPQEWEMEAEMFARGVEADDEVMEEDDNESDCENLEEGERLFMLPESIDHLIRTKTTFSTEIAEKEAKRVERRKAGLSIPDLYVKDFRPIFEKEEFDELPARTKWDHAIELKEDSTPFTSKIYPLSKDEQKELDAFIEEHLRSGRIRPSKSPIASPFFFVKKKDGKLRPVQDFR